MRYVSQVAGVLLLTAVMAPASPAAAAAKSKGKTAKPAAKPVGVKLPAAQLKSVQGQVCGRIGGVWLPGTMTKSLRFQTYTSQASAATRKAKTTNGAAHRTQLRRATSFTRLAKDQRRLCQLKLKPAKAPAPGPVPYMYAPAIPYITPSTAPVQFDLRGAVGITSQANVTPTTNMTAPASNLGVVDGTGQLRDAVVSGRVSAGEFLIAPNNKLYVLFAYPTPLAGQTSATTCLIAEVSPANGTPTCIDSSLSSVNYNTNPGSAANPAIQFDDAGSIYYLGRTTDGRLVLRRSANGVITDLVTDQAYAGDFLVLGDGTVLLSGSTTATSAIWTRRVAPSGSLRTLKTANTSFMRRFPDGNVYMGLTSGSDYGVSRYLTAGDAMDPAAWIGSRYYYDESTAPVPHNLVSTICDSAWQDHSSFCGNRGSYVSRIFPTADGKVFVISGGGATGQLMQYFPTVAATTTNVKNVAVAQGVINDVVLSGLNAEDRNITTLYDTSTGAERQLIGPDQELELYHLNYVTAGNKVLFDGLRFADNKYVLGQVDLTTGTVTTTAALTSRLTGFQTFR